jgi:hypothetical protein
MMTAAEAWAKQYRSGKTLRQIADAAGVGTRRVHAELRAAGVPMRPAAPSGEWRARLPALVAQGLSCEVIAERLGKHPGTVERVVRELGLRT